MLKHLLFALVFMTLVAPIVAEASKVYVWRNEHGQLVFSDSPRPGAEEVEISGDQTIIPSVDTSILDIKPKAIDERYDIEITQPVDHATIRDNTGSVYITGRIKPIFKRGLKVRLLIDDKPYQEPSDRVIFSLRNVDRGEHRIKLELLNEKGKVIASSTPVTFYMHRASVN